MEPDRPERPNRPLTIFHLFSNHKWTGPAEPAVNLALQSKAMGHRILFAGGHCPDDGSSILQRIAQERGLEPLEGLTLSKHRNRRTDADDVESIALVISKEKPDIVHVHMMNDHDIAIRAIARATHRPLLIRTLYDGELRPDRRLRGLLEKTDGVVCLSRAVRKQLISQGLLTEEASIEAEGTVDTERFAPRAKSETLAAKLGIGSDQFVVGIVARVQRHRRFEILIEAAKIALPEDPDLRFMIVGRGTHREEIIIRPVETAGLSEKFIFTGYRGEDYVDIVNLFDAKLFLMPGTDGSCRAVRELMALGKPVIAADRGMLGEIVTDGVDGFVVEDTAANLARAIQTLATDRERAERMGAAAAKKAVERFTLESHAQTVDALYARLDSAQVSAKGR